MRAQPLSERRRGWCPGVRRPMATGDGLLVRLHPISGRLVAGQACLIAAAAREHGNGHLDITARGNLQIRGVSEETYPALLALLEREGLAEPEGDSPNRLAVVSPLAGLDALDRFDALALAQAIEDRAGNLDGLPAKFFVAVDGGGAFPLDAIGADLHLAAGENGSVVFSVPSLEGPNAIGAAALSRAPEAAHVLLSGFASMRNAERTEARRLRDLEPHLMWELAASAELKPATMMPRRLAAPRAGIIGVHADQAVLLALPFGRCSTAQLERAAEWSERFGTGDIHLSFTRGILLVGLSDGDAAMLLAEAEGMGFITNSNDPRLSLLACPGKPDCGSGLTSAPADALRLAEAWGGRLPPETTVHVSGCPKGCAHPGRADLTLVGRDDGRYDVVPNGSSRDISSLHLSLDEIMTRFLPNTFADPHRAFPERER